MAIPFLDRFTSASPGEVRGETEFQREMPVLQDHRLADIPLIPAAVLLEMCAQAAHRLRPISDKVCVKDFRVETGARFYDDRPQSLRTAAWLVNDEEIHCEVTGEYVDRRTQQREPDRVYARCRFVSENFQVDSAPQPLPKIYESLLPASPGAHEPRLAGTVVHGPSWNALVGIHEHSPESNWFQIDHSCLPVEVQSRMSAEWTISPVIDAILQACDVAAVRSQSTAQLPAGCGSLWIAASQISPDNSLQALVSRTELTGKGLLFDVAVWNHLLRPVCVARNVELLFRRSSAG